MLSRGKMTLWIWLLLPLIDLMSDNCNTKFGGNWTTNKGDTEEETEGGWVAHIITKYPSLNRVKNKQNSFRVLPKHVHLLNTIYSLKASFLCGQKASFERLLLTNIFHIGLNDVLCILSINYIYKPLSKVLIQMAQKIRLKQYKSVHFYSYHQKVYSHQGFSKSSELLN